MMERTLPEYQYEMRCLRRVSILSVVFLAGAILAGCTSMPQRTTLIDGIAEPRPRDQIKITEHRVESITAWGKCLELVGRVQ